MSLLELISLIYQLLFLMTLSFSRLSVDYLVGKGTYSMKRSILKHPLLDDLNGTTDI